jgi:hypothetical protein
MPLLTVLLFSWLPLAQAGDDDAALREADQALKKAGVATDGPALLRFLQARTLSPARAKEIQALVNDLGSLKYQQREKAASSLVQAGTAARAQLRLALAYADCEVARRADLVLQKIPAGAEVRLTEAALRLLAARKPAGAAEALLAFLPCVADDSVEEETRAALAAVAVRNGKPEPAVIAALADADASRRSAAAEALCRAGARDRLPHLLQIAKELPPARRLPVGVALVEAREKAGVPLLIDLLPQLPAHEVWRAEEVLYRLAGDQAPAVVGRDMPAARARELWRAWWHKHGAGLDLAKLAEQPRMVGFTLVSLADVGGKGGLGRVYEVGPDRQVRWQIDQLRYPVDVQVTGHDRVLIAEYLARRVTERDFTGKVLWEYQVDLPISCQRLPNGHTFIATRRQLVELNRDGAEVYAHTPGTGSIAAAQKLRNGQVVMVSGLQCLRLEAGTNKVLHTFPVGLVYNLGGNIDVLPNGRVLVPEYRNNKVVEYDPDGKPCWEVSAPMPTSVMRLPNGHTLVVCIQQQRVLEFDRNGREVEGSLPPIEGRPWRVRKR